MTQTARHPLPLSYRAVIAEQVRTVGVAAWREAAAITALLAVVASAAIAARVGASENFEGQPAGMPFFVLVGFLSPFVFWKGEKLHDGAYLWTLPVDRRRHALAKSFAGWVWLMGSIAGFLGWLAAVTLLSGGTIGAQDTRLMLPPRPFAEPLSWGDLREVPWRTPWAWIVPFTAGTLAYLFGTAFLLGVKHRLRWGAALLLGLIALAILTAEGVLGGPARAFLRALLSGPYGLDWALTGGVGLSDEFITAEGREAVAWRDFQTAGAWLRGTAVWTLVALVALWAALRRHRER